MIASRKTVGADLWRRLQDRRIGLTMLWQDATFKTWHAYGHWPALPEERLPAWAMDDRTTVMSSGKTMEEAVELLITDPRIGKKVGLAVTMAELGVEICRLAETISHVPR